MSLGHKKRFVKEICAVAPQGGPRGAPQGAGQQTVAKPEYIKLCKGRYFLLSKAVDAKDKTSGRKSLQRLSKYRQKLEVDYGAYLGAGDTTRLLRGFPEGRPLGAGTLVQNEDLNLHHDDLSNDVWVRAYGEYGAATMYGVLMMAGTVENFQVWRNSRACLKEVANIPAGRLFAYIEHKEDDTGGRRGYIVQVDAQGDTASATVKDGKGYAIWADGDYYAGELRSGLPEGRGTYRHANGDEYEGEWKGGKCEGRGTFRFADGAVYDGEYKDNNREGRGTERFADGSVYEGEWKDDKWDGRGTLRLANGEAEVGRYRAGEDVGEGAMWSANRKKAWRLLDGKEAGEISLAEAAAIAARVGVPVPV